MLFSGIPFLFYFLPVVLLVYFAVPFRLKNAVLLLFSLVFYAWGEPRYVLLMIASILFFYACGIAIGRSERRKKLYLTISVLGSIALLGVFKYADFFVGNINLVTGLDLPLLRLALPIGISFYTFQCLSYTIDVYRGDALVQKNPVTFGAYVSLFPQLIAGPIVRYVDVQRQLDDRTHSFQNFYDGISRFLVGLGKKILLSNNLAVLTSAFRQTADKSVVFYWLYAIAYTLHVYFDFSGYSDMAIGLGKLFGFHFPENFRYPYISGSVSEFWRRWHISLGSWFRDYVYIPLGGNRVNGARLVRNILAVWLLTGLWHGAAWNFVLWGLLYAAFLMLEKFVPAMARLPRLLRHIYVLLVVIAGFVLFNAESVAQAASDLGGMIGIGGAPFINQPTLYYLKSNAVLLIAGIVGATPLCKTLYCRLKQSVRDAVKIVALPALLIICTAYLVDGSFNPFLYFRF